MEPSLNSVMPSMSTPSKSTRVPKAVATADPTYAAIAPEATVQVAASVIVTAILTPLLTSWMHRRVQRGRGAAPAGETAATTVAAVP